mgnify:CR=1 FL=1
MCAIDMTLLFGWVALAVGEPASRCLALARILDTVRAFVGLGGAARP